MAGDDRQHDGPDPLLDQESEDGQEDSDELDPAFELDLDPEDQGTAEAAAEDSG